MSYSEQVKEELAELQIKPMCCRKAFLSGLLLGAQVEQNAVSVKLPASLGERTQSEIKRHFGRESSCVPFVHGKQSGVEICFDSPKCAAMIETWDARIFRPLSNAPFARALLCAVRFAPRELCQIPQRAHIWRSNARRSHVHVACKPCLPSRGLPWGFCKEGAV